MESSAVGSAVVLGMYRDGELVGVCVCRFRSRVGRKDGAWLVMPRYERGWSERCLQRLGTGWRWRGWLSWGQRSQVVKMNVVVTLVSVLMIASGGRAVSGGQARKAGVEYMEESRRVQKCRAAQRPRLCKTSFWPSVSTGSARSTVDQKGDGRI